MAELTLDAEFELLATDQGGRRSPIETGYRPALWFGETGPGGAPELHSCVVRIDRAHQLAPGEVGQVSIVPLAFETWPHVKAGTRFDVYDAARAIGSGTLRTVPTPASAAPQLRQALSSALEEWALDRFGERVVRRQREKRLLDPDLFAWFEDPEGHRHVLVATVIARRLRPRDIKRIARVMRRHSASLGVVVTFDEPSAGTLGAIYDQGTIALPGGVLVPRVRVVTTHDLARGDLDLVPAKQRPGALEILAAA